MEKKIQGVRRRNLSDHQNLLLTLSRLLVNFRLTMKSNCIRMKWRRRAKKKKEGSLLPANIPIIPPLYSFLGNSQGERLFSRFTLNLGTFKTHFLLSLQSFTRTDVGLWDSFSLPPLDQNEFPSAVSGKKGNEMNNYVTYQPLSIPEMSTNSP